MSLAVQAATWHMQMYQAGADRQYRSEPENCAFPSIEYVLVLHFMDHTTWLPVTANLAINFLGVKFMLA